MMLQSVKCPVCHGLDFIKYGNTSNGKQRFIGKD